MNKKIVQSLELLELLMLNKSWNYRIVFTNGCFDILHVGHLHLFQEAKWNGGVLIVGLNSDESVKRLKGPDRPINCQADRAEILAGLELVDYVIIFDEDTPEKLIQQIKPDVLVKGNEYEIYQIAGAKFVLNNGGSILRVSMLPKHSSSKIIERL